MCVVYTSAFVWLVCDRMCGVVCFVVVLLLWSVIVCLCVRSHTKACVFLGRGLLCAFVCVCRCALMVGCCVCVFVRFVYNGVCALFVIYCVMMLLLFYGFYVVLCLCDCLEINFGLFVLDVVFCLMRCALCFLVCLCVVYTCVFVCVAYDVLYDAV